MKKHIFSLLMIVMLVMGTLSACSSKTTSEETKQTAAAGGNTVAPEDTAAPEKTAAAAENTVHKSKNGIETKDNGAIRKELTSIDLTTLMGNGINLGNTMEAYGHATLGIKAEVSKYETTWGMPVTTQEMITGMKKAGFNSLRIPIAWTNMMDFENKNYTINEAYFNRVEEIMNYAFNEGMYVIINDHWDGGWWGMFGSATEATRNEAMTMYTSMWKQIAERYAEYSDYLIFESGNEEIGNRLNDVDIAKDSGKLSEDECYKMSAKINQAFVDTVRKTGGNNEQRFLLIAGYNTNIADTCDDRFVMPTDTAENKLILSVHFYDPDGYCQRYSVTHWGSKKNYADMNETLAKLTKFTDKGCGIIIGEYGVLMEGQSNPKDNTTDYYKNFLNNCDYHGYAPMLWDCNSMFDRNKQEFVDKNVAKIFLDHSLATQEGKSQEDIKAAAKKAMDDVVATLKDEKAVNDKEAKAWLMYNSSDWGMLYSVGDVYDPTSMTEGIVPTDVQITGAGQYKVGLDFTKTAAKSANSVVFSAVGIANGEKLYPGYVITIDEIEVNGKTYKYNKKSYTTSDDKKCTRVNLYNEWVTEIPKEARTIDGNLSKVTPNLLDAKKLGNVKTIYVTFTYGPAKK
ncbi:MAG: glycoside hydrolase family 5 protein [bacterium]|nr:glycoside hydrolase family 5 protein [bacterium]